MIIIAMDTDRIETYLYILYLFRFNLGILHGAGLIISKKVPLCLFVLP